MALYHRVIAKAYDAHSLLRNIGRAFGRPLADSLRVLIYHDIAPASQEQFAAQLRWLARSWKFVSPAQFAAMMSGDEPIRGRNLLLTMDDGYASNRTVAEQVLNPMGIRALFFAISDFVSFADRDAARQFVASNIFPVPDVAAIPAHWYNMSWSDLEALLEQGHTIGAHTRTHAKLSQIQSETELEREIIGGADTLAQRLGVDIEHFAYTFGDLASFSPQALAIARKRFRFIYSGLRGENAGGVSPLLVRRDAVNAEDPLSLVGGYVEGLVDLRYARSRAQLASWI